MLRWLARHANARVAPRPRLRCPALGAGHCAERCGRLSHGSVGRQASRQRTGAVETVSEARAAAGSIHLGWGHGTRAAPGAGVAGGEGPAGLGCLGTLAGRRTRRVL